MTIIVSSDPMIIVRRIKRDMEVPTSQIGRAGFDGKFTNDHSQLTWGLILENGFLNPKPIGSADGTPVWRPRNKRHSMYLSQEIEKASEAE